MKTITKFATTAAMASLLSACALPQTPIAQQDTLKKERFDIRHQEDRVTLLFSNYEDTLNGEHRSKIQRFVNYYKKMDPNKTDFLIAELIYPDAESSKVPTYNRRMESSLMDVKDMLHEHGVEYHVIKEMDLYPDTNYVEAEARRAILSTSTGDEDLEALKPEMTDLKRPYKLALIVRKYDVRAAKCPHVGGIDWGVGGINRSQTVGTGINTGCSVHSGLISQVKDKTHFVYGDKTEGTFASEYEIKRLNDFYEGDYSSERNNTDNVTAEF